LRTEQQFYLSRDGGVRKENAELAFDEFGAAGILGRVFCEAD
jgi:hypothetical protein